MMDAPGILDYSISPTAASGYWYAMSKLET